MNKMKWQRRNLEENRLLSEGLKLAKWKGLNSFTSEDLAKECEIPIGNLFYYLKKSYDGKMGILRTEIAKEVLKTTNKNTVLQLDLEDQSELQILRLYLESKEFLKQYRGYSRLMFANGLSA